MLIYQKFHDTPSTQLNVRTEHQSTIIKNDLAVLSSRRSPFDGLDGLERLVHVADAEVEAELHHGEPGGLVGRLQALEVAHHVARDLRGPLGGQVERRARLLWRGDGLSLRDTDGTKGSWYVLW